MKAKLALGAAAFFAFGGAADAATAPFLSTYNIVAYNLSQTGSGCTSGDVGSTSVGTLYYPGPASPGATLYQVKNNSAKYGFSIVTLPKTPASGATSWSGSFSAVEQPSGKVKTGTFTATFTFIDTGHFLLLLKPVQNGCTQTIQVTAYSLSSGPPIAARKGQ